jgi:4-hydroxy 2-oxovalerate aldolase
LDTLSPNGTPPLIAEDIVRPAMPAECLFDSNALVIGYSSFLMHAIRQSERYGVPAHKLLHRAGSAS